VGNVLNLLALLTKTEDAQMANDKIIWPHDSKWMFTVKSFFREACEGSCNLEFPAHAMWRSKAATKARFLA